MTAHRRKGSSASTTPIAISAALIQTAQTILREPENPPADIAFLAVTLAQLAWNESVTGERPAEAAAGIREVWLKNPAAWKHFSSTDLETLLADLLAAKQGLFPHDYRFVVWCKITPDGAVRAEWAAIGSA